MTKQLFCIGAGLVVFLFLCWSLRDLERAKKFRYLAAVGGIGLLLINLVFGVEQYGAKNWIYIAGMSFQPSELVKLCFIFVGASTLQRIMTKRNMFLFIAYSAMVCGCLVLMSDFGTALIFFVAFLVIAYMRSGSFATIALIVSATGFGGVLALRFKPYILNRFSAWGHVWEDALNTGYQQTRSMMCIASGGLFGLGAGRGCSNTWPRRTPTMVFAFVGEEWGLLMAIFMILAVVCLAAFVAKSASVGRSSFYTIGACAAGAILLIQTMLNVFGTVDLLPLTGVTFPFVSNGGSSMIACWGLLAFIKAADTRQNASVAVRLPSKRILNPRRSPHETHFQTKPFFSSFSWGFGGGTSLFHRPLLPPRPGVGHLPGKPPRLFRLQPLFRQGHRPQRRAAFSTAPAKAASMPRMKPSASHPPPAG